LVAQHIEIGDRLTTIGEHDGNIGHHRATVMNRV
jgi:hypothetical protein